MAAGKKTGGRKKGVRNKRTEANRAAVALAASEGITPLDVMLGAMRAAWENGDKPGAATIAKDAAPYMHPKLSNVQLSGDADNPLETVTRIELVSPLDHDDSSDCSAAETYPCVYGTG